MIGGLNLQFRHLVQKSDKNTSSANTKATSPNTGDMTPIAIYVVMAAAAVGVIVLVKRRKTA